MQYTKTPQKLPVSPLGNGAGIIKTEDDFNKFLKIEDIPEILIGSITSLPREGNSGNTFYSGPGYTLNALGLPNPGIQYWLENDRLKKCAERAHKKEKQVGISIVGFKEGELGEIAQIAEDAEIDFIEINAGCPNVWAEGKQKEIISFSSEALSFALGEIYGATEKIKIGFKLSPYSNPGELERIAKFFNLTHKAFDRISFITTCNTFPNSFSEDEEGNPRISANNGYGGMAGEAIIAIALGQVKQFKAVLIPEIKIKGVGGITKGSDVRNFFKAGASMVQIVSAYYRNEDLSVFSRIRAEYEMLTEKV